MTQVYFQGIACQVLHRLALDMPLVQERVHPAGLDFAMQRRVVVLRDMRGLTFSAIARQVTNLKGLSPTPRTVANVYWRFESHVGRRPYRYGKCGRRPWKLDRPTERFLIAKLKQLRVKGGCTAAVLQRVLAEERGVHVSVTRVRRALRTNGYRWLPRALKRKHSPAVQLARVAFAQAVLDIPPHRLTAELCMCMDGVVLSMPPSDATARINYCRSADDHVWRKPSELNSQALAGGDIYHKQVPIERCIPLWGGVGARGFAPVVFHPRKKLCNGEWVTMVSSGKLRAAVSSASGKRRRPWAILCDNEKFLHSPAVKDAHKAAGMALWHIPPRSPDLNPIERFWSWLRRRLLALDLKDAAARRPTPGKMLYRQRVRTVLRSRRAREVAIACYRGLRQVCQQVVDAKGGAVHG